MFNEFAKVIVIIDF